ncbi:MAG: aminotransferase class V-fold PLP-dependent enzyme [Ruminococcaceae bacterium]|nr:aminotransferase class V-fold PLP-dependent enzyme [Oscillospiraceae bacterium]
MIYFDNSATTAPSAAARAAALGALDGFGNPSSLHALGYAAEKKLTESRAHVMSALAAKSGKLIFTASGSEANNLAIIGSANAKTRRTANRILTTDCEHPSVENTVAELAKQGFEVVKIPTKGGALDMSALDAALDKPVFLASFMLVNNETGSVFDCAAAFSKIKAKYPDAICHTDAVQGFLKVKFSPVSLKADMITVSGHKIHAIKGVGALWVSDAIIKAKKLVPTVHGGGQEDGYRSGTENTVGIAAFGAAAEEGARGFASDIAYINGLRDYAIEKLCGAEVKLNLPIKAAPHVLSVTLPHIKSETMLHFLSSKGICVSSGSACSSHSAKTSSSLVSFGLAPKEADCTIRVSFCRYNTKEEIDALADAINEGLKNLVRIR